MCTSCSDSWLLKGMDKSSINSLNSKRNFKLPPIQGALPATLYGERSWSTNKPSLTHGPRQAHVKIKKEPIPSRDFHSFHRANCHTRAPDHFPKKASFSSPRQHTTVEINLGHEFPKSYSVLPPISKEPDAISNENSSLLSATKINPAKRETRTVDKKYSTASELLSERRRERLLEKQRAQNDLDHDQGDLTTVSTGTEKEITKTSKTEKSKEIEESRKKSATYLLYLKCKRNYRRGGVCPENESSLINVTEQLKEIFLRKNMEEMYLI